MGPTPQMILKKDLSLLRFKKICIRIYVLKLHLFLTISSWSLEVYCSHYVGKMSLVKWTERLLSILLHSYCRKIIPRYGWFPKQGHNNVREGVWNLDGKHVSSKISSMTSCYILGGFHKGVSFLHQYVHLHFHPFSHSDIKIKLVCHVI